MNKQLQPVMMLLEELANTNWYGVLALQFREGKIELIRKEQTLRLEDLEPMKRNHGHGHRTNS